MNQNILLVEIRAQQPKASFIQESVQGASFGVRYVSEA